MVMDQPGPLVCPYHGNVAIDYSIFLVGEVLLNCRPLLVDFPIGLFEILPVRLDKAILGGVDEPSPKKERPQRLHVDLTGKMGVRIKGTGQEVCQTAVRIDIHVENGKATPDPLSLLF